MHVTAALAESGKLVDAAVGAGANNVGGPNVDTSDQTSLYNRALDRALGDAKQKAEAIAKATGLTLGTALKVHEGGSSTGVVFADALGAARPVATPPIEAGTQKIQASVTVTYSAG